MIRPKDKYHREIREPDSPWVIPFGPKDRHGDRSGRIEVRKVPGSQADIPEILRAIQALKPPGPGKWRRGEGDQHILDHDCDLHYYINKKKHGVFKVRH